MNSSSCGQLNTLAGGIIARVHKPWRDAPLSPCSAKQEGAEGLARAGSDKAWSLPLGAALLGVRQLGLNGWEPAECGALENELRAWQEAGHLAEPVQALRWGNLHDLHTSSSSYWCP